MTPEFHEVLDEPLIRLGVKGRTHACLTELFGAQTTPRELMSMPLEDLTAEVRKKHPRPGIIINDLAAALRMYDWHLGTDPYLLPRSSMPARDLRYIRAYPGMSRRRSALMILWLRFYRYEAIGQGDEWATRDISNDLDHFEKMKLEDDKQFGGIESIILGQGWQEVHSGERHFSLRTGLTIKDVLDAYFLPE